MAWGVGGTVWVEGRNISKYTYYNIPKNPKLYLSLVYGKNWMVPDPNGVADEELWLSGFKGTTYSEQIEIK